MDAVKYHTCSKCARQGRGIREMTTVMPLSPRLQPVESSLVLPMSKEWFFFNRIRIKAAAINLAGNPNNFPSESQRRGRREALRVQTNARRAPSLKRFTAMWQDANQHSPGMLLHRGSVGHPRPSGRAPETRGSSLRLQTTQELMSREEPLPRL